MEHRSPHGVDGCPRERTRCDKWDIGVAFGRGIWYPFLSPILFAVIVKDEMCLFAGHLRSTKDVAASDGVGHACPIYIALHTDIARRIRTDYEHGEGGESILNTQDGRGRRG